MIILVIAIVIAIFNFVAIVLIIIVLITTFPRPAPEEEVLMKSGSILASGGRSSLPGPVLWMSSLGAKKRVRFDRVLCRFCGRQEGLCTFCSGFWQVSFTRVLQGLFGGVIYAAGLLGFALLCVTACDTDRM